jgi:hypothetical protein
MVAREKSSNQWQRIKKTGFMDAMLGRDIYNARFHKFIGRPVISLQLFPEHG